ncbi:MurR/RpiR family transcriptional regulator [Romboutsia weinsteinii]|uniref:MurR/RpiR family transcriptional regulator n=1 Tax=Romboutsia weinsteinii TaxID=2020949 RepID=A0A371J8Y2_9FIRM|nr:MurR/RpiR family transcriptional regulator [Romboutsia weinsteinii]RDY29173.1 MurR/RpiR family transcriptional regulator [Romboutsia weinsteinii]
MSCILKLNQVYKNLTEVDKKIADYVLDNKEEVCKMTVSGLANNCGGSTASIVRFCRKLGYDGFSDFKIELAKEKDNNESKSEYAYIDEKSSLDSIIESISNKNANTIYKSVSLNNNKDIKDAVDYIQKAKKVYIYGIGGSSLVSQDLQMKLVRINKNTITFTDSHMQLMSSNNVTEGDVAIGISYSGESKEVVESMKKSKCNKATCIGITKFGESSLSSLCDINLYVSNVENSLREGAISSRIAMLTLVDIIYIALIQNDIKENEAKLMATRELVKVLK